MRGVGILDEISKLHLVALDSFPPNPWQVLKAKGFFYNGVSQEQREDGVMIPNYCRSA